MADDLTVQEYISNMIDQISQRGDIEDPNFNILSTNGIMIEGMTEVLENAIYKYQDASRERFISTSEKRSSLIKHGYRFKNDERFAKPSSMPAMVIVDIDEVVELAEEISDDVYEYRYPKGFEFNVGDYYFTLDYDIIINIYYKEDGSRSMKTTYDIDDTNPLSELSNPNIKSIQFSEFEREYLGMLLNLKQFRRVDTEYSYFSRFSDRSYVVGFDDNLADFNVYYKVSEESDEEMLLNKTNNMVTTSSIKNETIFYEFKSENELLLTNRYEMGNFLPESGSRFRVEVLETMGEDGNFTYTGDYIQETNVDGLTTRIMPRDSAIGGEDEPDIGELKEELIDYNTRRDGITSTPDLERVLADIDTKYKIFKYRDDVFYKIYNVFSMLYDSEKRVIPANTLDTYIDASDLTKQEKIINEGTPDEYTIVDYILPDTHQLNLDNSGETPKAVSADIETTHQYKYPYKLIYNYSIGEQYVNDTKIFKNILDEQYYPEYEFINPYIPINYMINKLKFKANAGYDYEISFELRSNTAYPVDFLHSFIVDREHLTNSDGEKLFTYVDEHGDDVEVTENYTEISETAISKNVSDIESFDSMFIDDSVDLSVGDEFYLYLGSEKYDTNVRTIYELNDQSDGSVNLITEETNLPTNLTTEQIGYLSIVKIERLDVYDLDLDPIYDYTYALEREAEDDVLVDEDYIRPILLIEDNGNFEGYITFNMDDYISDGDYYEYSTKLNFLNEIDSRSKVSLELYDANHNKVQRDLNVEDLDFSLYIITKDEVEEEIDFDPQVSLSSFELSNVYTFNADLYKDLSYINRLQIEPLYDTGTFNQLKISYMPLVQYDYFENQPEKLLDKIDYNVRSIENVYEAIKDDFQISLLFINTYGPSRYFTLGLTNDNLEKINISLSFRMRFLPDADLTKKEIKEFIVSHIDSINFLEYENFHVSKLIKEIKNEYPGVEFIEFLGINDNGADKQLVSIEEDVEATNMIPEYLNVFYKTVNNELEPDINITLV